MNTGIQDAVNLAWKLAHSLRGAAGVELLDTYQAERAPVGAMVLRFTDRAFTIATSTNPAVRFARTRLAPAMIPLLLGPAAVRRYAFRTVTQLGIGYRRSPLSVDGPHPPRRGPRAGDRLPDAPIIHNGQSTTLHTLTGTPGWHLLLCGLPPPVGIDAEGPITVHHLSGADAAAGPYGQALRVLGVAPTGAAHYLVRPDGHIGFRAGGNDLGGLYAYLRRWLRP